MKRHKIALIGAGQIGTVLSHLIALRRMGDIIFYDIVKDLPQGKTLDMLEASSLDGFNTRVVGTNSYEDIKDADLVIVTAGVPRKPGMSRDDLLTVNSKVIRGIAENVSKFAPYAIVILISNPLDAMVTLFQHVSGFPVNRVIGQAGVLDSARFSFFIAQELCMSAKDVTAMVLGGHGDTMVPLIRTANVHGIPVMDLLEQKYGSLQKAENVMEALVERTRQAGDEIVELLKTGSAFYSPASATAVMAEAILHDEHRVLPVCAYLNGEYGLHNLYMGVPAVLGSPGVENIVEMSLTPDEKALFLTSAKHVRDLVDRLKTLKLLD
ncbi:MAG: malate dehydrogenase [Candidatus Marinimicrobia bacterium]|nr:malate dehydrogenase [Candidatus Neomarinimicrobiota bacterium]MDD5583030.1 malate dehydrogenase [Candidatus Neomarinimicrobiota bacterium]